MTIESQTHESGSVNFRFIEEQYLAHLTAERAVRGRGTVREHVKIRAPEALDLAVYALAPRSANRLRPNWPSG